MKMALERPETDALGQNRPDFRSAVMIIDNNLHDEDVKSVKFLCQGLVVASKLKRVETVHELVGLLENAKHVSEMDFFLLADLLQYIQRIDVLQSIGYEEEEVMLQRHTCGSKIDPFYVLLFKISEDLPDEDVRKANYMYGKVPRATKVTMGLDLFVVMLQHQAIGPSDVGLLTTIFQSIERQDVLELINRYNETGGQSVMDDLQQQFRTAMSLQGIPVNNLLNMRTQFNAVPVRRDLDNSFSPTKRGIDEADRNPVGLPVLLRPAAEHSSSQWPNNFHASSNAHLSMGPQALSFPSVEVNVEPQSEPSSSSTSVESSAPEGFDKFVIPWPVLRDISALVPNVHWQELSAYLGVPLTSEWDQQKTSSQTHKLAVLKRWLELPEIRSMESVNVYISLVKALTDAGCALLAERLASEMNINYASIMQNSSRLSAYEENTVASEAHAAPESLVSSFGQPDSLSNVRAAPVVSRMEEASRNPIPHYKMDSAPRGICVIMNNRDFYKDPNNREAKEMVSREGTDIDRDKLFATFTQLNFRVMAYDNLTDTDMIRVIQQMAFDNHSMYDCFVCCILTHGIQGHLYGVNGLVVPIRDLTSPLRAQSCPSLAGKPKMFFMQACQGRDKQGGQDVQMDSVEVDSPPEMIPNESDFLLGYATVPGFVSYRSKTRGSWYITKLTEALNKHGYDHDILDILTLVNYEVGKGDALIDGGPYKQSPAPMYTLRKKLIFTHP